MNRPSGIYQIQSKIKPERIYVGSAVSILQRWHLHLKKLAEGKHHSFKLQNHVNKYGVDDLQFSILEPCFPEWLVNREQFYLNKLKPYFNICKVAGSVLGIKRSPETIERCKKAQKGRTFSEETRKKMSEAKKGKPSGRIGFHHSDETKQKLREINLGIRSNNKGIFQVGHRNSPETIAKIIAKTKGRKRTDATKLKISNALKGNKKLIGNRNAIGNKGKLGQLVSEETKRKIGDANRGRKFPPMSAQARVNIGLGHIGLKFSDESRKKMSESAKKREELKRLKKQIIIQSPSLCN